MRCTTASTWCFNPWNSLPEHRPLGSVNRMRFAVYLASRQVRRKLNMVGHEQPPKPDRSGGLQRTQAPPNVENEALHAERRQLNRGIYRHRRLDTRVSGSIPRSSSRLSELYRDICDEQIRHYGGHIARMIGDGLLAFLASRKPMKTILNAQSGASLAIAAAIKEHKFLLSDGSFVRLGVRIGVNTGVVVVGSVPGEPPDRREVFGSSAHVAARLQGLASENGVVVGSSTHELTPRNVQLCARLAGNLSRAWRSRSRPGVQRRLRPAKAGSTEPGGRLSAQ